MPRAPGYVGPSDKRRTRKARQYIVGLDGEGVGRTPHRYTLLAWQDATGERSAHVQDARGLGTARCLRFLLSMPLDAKPFGYFIQYDWTMILRDLPNPKLYVLFRPRLRKIPKDEGGGFVPVRWRGYKLHYLAGMMRIQKRGRTLTVWDVGRFFQAPFCDGSERSALETWNVGTPDERERIASMKARRDRFSRRDSARIREYCLDECRLLAKLVGELNKAHDDIGLPLRSWHGPGSSASVALKRWGIAKKRGDIPRPVAEAARRAFFGGRFEQSTIGFKEGPIHSYDIVSAYPAIMVDLPCLEHTRWELTERESVALRAEQAVVRYELAASRSRRAWGPLPCRMKNGTIVFPRSGASGWVWLEEFRAAKVWSQVRFVEAWVLKRDCACQPFAGIRELFAERLRVGKKSGRGHSLKLVYNSGYGKLAQRIGSPQFRSQVWAGMITSGTRAKLLGPLAKADDDILAVATDGLYSRVALPMLTLGKELGAWDHETHDSIVLVRPGIYWTPVVTKARGLPRRTVESSQDAILDGIRLGLAEVQLPPVTQFGGALAYVQCSRDGRFRRHARYGQWFKRPAKVSLAPAPKRRHDWGLWDLDGVESAPYGVARSPDAETLRLVAMLAWGNQ